MRGLADRTPVNALAKDGNKGVPNSSTWNVIELFKKGGFLNLNYTSINKKGFGRTRAQPLS
jgi:hypothetical protein